MKKMNNKGFSLVELIIVIAIMAILIAVLAPQYLRYVEKSRLQSDNSMIGEVGNAVKVAASNDDINASITDGETWTPNTTAGAATFTSSLLNAELLRVCGSELKVTSNSYKSTAPTITINVGSDGAVKVSASNYKKDVSDTSTTTIDL
jgi:type IV pilus assembly protein PilA